MFRYELDPVGNLPEILRRFRVIPENGTLFANAEFDREQNSSYRMKINARDMGEPSRQSSIFIHVDIEDLVRKLIIISFFIY